MLSLHAKHFLNIDGKANLSLTDFLSTFTIAKHAAVVYGCQSEREAFLKLHRVKTTLFRTAVVLMMLSKCENSKLKF